MGDTPSDNFTMPRADNGTVFQWRQGGYCRPARGFEVPDVAGVTVAVRMISADRI